jgi:hypothetical protein
VSWADREVYVKVSRETIETAPDCNPAAGIGPYDEIKLLQHYGREVAGQ